MPGTPKSNAKRQRNPERNKSIFHTSFAAWTTPAAKSATGKGNQNASTGTMMVEIPNPVTVPMVLARRVSRVRRRMSIGD